MTPDRIYSTESGKIDGLHRDARSNWDKNALHFSYETDGDTIELYTTGGRTVVFKSKEAAELVVLLMNRFPGLVLDALGNV